MSLANLSDAFEQMRLRRDFAEGRARTACAHLKDIMALVGQCLLDGDAAAKEWLTNLAQEDRERPL